MNVLLPNEIIAEYICKYRETKDRQYRDLLINQAYHIIQVTINLMKRKRRNTYFYRFILKTGIIEDLPGIVILRIMEELEKKNDIYNALDKAEYFKSVISYELNHFFWVRQKEYKKRIDIDDLMDLDWLDGKVKNKVGRDTSFTQYQLSITLQALNNYEPKIFMSAPVHNKDSVKLIKDIVANIKKHYYNIYHGTRKSRYKKIKIPIGMKLGYKVEHNVKGFLIYFYKRDMENYIQNYYFMGK